MGSTLFSYLTVKDGILTHYCTSLKALTKLEKIILYKKQEKLLFYKCICVVTLTISL